jgi:hypothetical protein
MKKTTIEILVPDEHEDGTKQRIEHSINRCLTELIDELGLSHEMAGSVLFRAAAAMIDIDDVDELVDGTESSGRDLADDILAHVAYSDAGRAIGQARATAERASQMLDGFGELEAYCRMLGLMPAWMDEIQAKCDEIDLVARLTQYDMFVDWNGAHLEEERVLEFPWPFESYRVDRVCSDYGLVEMVSRIEALSEKYGPPSDPEVFHARMENKRKAYGRSWETTEFLRAQDGPITAKELGAITGESGQAASGRLRQLHSRGLVVADRSGRAVSYRLDQNELVHQLEQLKKFRELMGDHALT